MTGRVYDSFVEVLSRAGRFWRALRRIAFGRRTGANSTNRLLLYLLIAVGAWLINSAQSASASMGLDEANQQQKLVLYSTMELPQNIDLINHFVRKYPLWDLELHPLDTSTLIERIQREARDGVFKWDVLLAGGGVFRPLFAANLIASYRSPEREGVSATFNDQNGFWSGYYVNSYMLGYNSNAARRDEVPTTYEGLLADRWKGKRIAIDGNAHGLLRTFTEVWGRNKAIAYLERLAEQQPVVVPESIIAVDSLHVGAVSLALGRFPVVHAYRRKLGSSIKWAFLDPVVAQIDAIMVSAQSRNPAAAKLFVDFAQSKEGQEVLASIQQVPIRRDMEMGRRAPIEGQAWFIEPPDKYEDLPETMRVFRRILGQR
jgi:iron(III) transport system substrate-binding protein